MTALIAALVSGAFLFTFMADGATARVRYDNHRVYRLQPKTTEQLAALQALDGERDSYVFLTPVHNVNTKVDVIVAPQRVPSFLLTTARVGLNAELLDENAQAHLETDEVAGPSHRTNKYNWQQYHELNGTYNWLHTLAKQHAEYASTFVAGQSYEGRQILGIRISHGSGRKVIILEGGMHAREWIGPAVTTYITNQLLSSSDKQVRLIAENFDWYIVPHANPDGYVYTHTTDRLWRKTRTPHKGGCYGADANRNWGFHWNEVGASDNPCTDTYAGPAAFSEIETKSLADFLTTLKSKILLYISFHAYSQLLLFPYGHTSELPPNNADYRRLSVAAIGGVQRRYGTKYTGGNVYDAIYPASGSSIDWAYGTIDVPYAFCYELRPSIWHFWTGFKLPAKQIIPTGEETLDSLIEMIKEAGVKKFE